MAAYTVNPSISSYKHPIIFLKLGFHESSSCEDKSVNKYPNSEPEQKVLE